MGGGARGQVGRLEEVAYTEGRGSQERRGRGGERMPGARGGTRREEQVRGGTGHLRGSGPCRDRVSPQGRERGFPQERTPRGGVSPLRVGDGRGRRDMLGCGRLWVRRGMLGRKGPPGGRRRGCWGERAPTL